jgi:hypothetical protein
MADHRLPRRPFNQTRTEKPILPARLFWQGKIGPAFWTIASLFSLSMNVVLIVLLVILGKQIFNIKSLVAEQLIGGLHENFVKMDEAHIRTSILVKDTIQVNDTLPVVFDLPLSTETQVILTQDTPINNATIYLNGMPVPLNLVLREGTPLNISLNLTVPVNQSVPVVLDVPIQLNVPVDIALSETDLHEPFVGLQNVISPYQELLSSLPNSWADTPLCFLSSAEDCNPAAAK